MSHALAGRSTLNTPRTEKGRIDVTKVKRYWKGKAPEWAEEEEESVVETEKRRATAVPIIISKTADPRLERLSLNAAAIEAASLVPSHRQMAKKEAETHSIPAATDLQTEADVRSVTERRAALRMKLLETRQDEPGLLPNEEDGESPSSSEYESDDGDGDEPGAQQRIPLMKPVYVSAEARETVHERLRLEEEEEWEWEAQKQKLKQRREDTKAMVALKIKEDEEALLNRDTVPTEAADINTDEEEDEEDAEFENWKRREMQRIKRDKEEMLLSEKYAEEREKLKNMTEEERLEYERLNPKIEVSKVKKKWKFLQKYWHKGAYYQEDPDDIRGAGTDVQIFGRDFSDATGEDRVDRMMMPKIMQVKNFGRSGRTKWTHLVNEDTTQTDDPWTADASLKSKSSRRMAASDQEFQKPKRFKS